MGGVGGCEGGGGSGYKPVGLSTSDRISLYMESKSAEGAVVATIGTATSVECKVSCLSSPSLLHTCAPAPPCRSQLVLLLRRREGVFRQFF